MSTPQEKLKKVKELAEESLRGGLYLKAAKLYHQAGEIAKELRNEGELIECLFWEGNCFQVANQKDDALPLFLQVSACQNPEVDPADIYGATTNAINLSLETKSLSFCRGLIRQSRAWLKIHQKEDWRHILDKLEGDLEYYRGEFVAAYQCHINAYHCWKGIYPYYTELTHLYSLCETTFNLRDISSLQKWVNTIESCSMEYEGEKVFAKKARLLLFRAQRSYTSSAAVDLAISTLDHMEMIDGVDGYSCITALRVLMLAKRWSEVDRIKEKYGMEEYDRFFGGLFLGDDQLCRARAALGMETRDDVYDLEFPDPAPPFPDLKAGFEYINKAIPFFELVKDDAGFEDERLETGYYTRTIEERLSRARRMEEVVKLYQKGV